MRPLFRPVAVAVSAALGLLAAALPATADMSFRAVPVTDGKPCRDGCPEVIVAEGQITSRSPDAFLDFARRSGQRARVRRLILVHSPGGEVSGAVRLGMLFRSVGATVMVARVNAPSGAPARFVGGACASACVYMLAGGRKRIVPPESRVGVHRMQVELLEVGGSDAARQRVRLRASKSAVQALRGYLGAMGVSPDLVGLAESIPHTSIRVLSSQEIARYRLAQQRL